METADELTLGYESHVCALADGTMPERLGQMALAGTTGSNDEDWSLLVEIPSVCSLDVASFGGFGSRNSSSRARISASLAACASVSLRTLARRLFWSSGSDVGMGVALRFNMKLTGARNAAKRHASVRVERHARPTYEIGAQVYIFPLAKTCQSLMN